MKTRISENHGTSSAGGVSVEGSSKLKMNSMKKKYDRAWKNDFNETSFYIDLESEQLGVYKKPAVDRLG